MVFAVFWSVAVNNVYKLQFFTYIFAVLLPDLRGLSCHSIQRMLWKWTQDIKRINQSTRSSTILGPDFRNRMVKRVKLRQPSPRYGDFSIFQDGGRPPSWTCCVCSDHPRRAFGGLYRCAKFGWNRCSSFDNMHVFRFREFGLKTPIHAPKLVFFWGGILPPK